MKEEKYYTAFGAIVDPDEILSVKYPVYEPHIRIPINWLKQGLKEVGCVARTVFMYMMPYMDWETKICFPTQEQLAEDSDLTLLQIQRGISELETHLIIRKEKLEVSNTKGRYHYQYKILL